MRNRAAWLALALAACPPAGAADQQPPQDAAFGRLAGKEREVRVCSPLRDPAAVVEGHCPGGVKLKIKHLADHKKDPADPGCEFFQTVPPAPPAGKSKEGAAARSGAPAEDATCLVAPAGYLISAATAAAPMEFNLPCEAANWPALAARFKDYKIAACQHLASLGQLPFAGEGDAKLVIQLYLLDKKAKIPAEAKKSGHPEGWPLFTHLATAVGREPAWYVSEPSDKVRSWDGLCWKIAYGASPSRFLLAAAEAGRFWVAVDRLADTGAESVLWEGLLPPPAAEKSGRPQLPGRLEARLVSYRPACFREPPE